MIYRRVDKNIVTPLLCYKDINVINTLRLGPSIQSLQVKKQWQVVVIVIGITTTIILF
jgi:hypothetical protein